MHKTKHILVAEDSEPDFLLLERAFKVAGLPHQLTRVRNGTHVIKYLKGEVPFQNRAISPLPHLLILDDNMPETSGMQLLAFLKEQGNPLPVVMLSGSGHPGDVQAALSLGAVEYLTKPPSPAELIVLAQTIHHRWLSNR